MFTPSLRQICGFCATLCVFTAPSLTFATEIQPTTFEDNLEDNGDCSLREAVQAANTNMPVDACPAGSSDETDTILLLEGTYTLSIENTCDIENINNARFDPDCGDLDAIEPVIFQGQGRDLSVIDAQYMSRGIEVINDGDFGFYDLTITRGNTYSEARGFGSGITSLSGFGTITIDRCNLERNIIDYDFDRGTFVFGAAAFFYLRSLHMRDSNIVHNSIGIIPEDIGIPSSPGVVMQGSIGDTIVERNFFGYNTVPEDPLVLTGGDVFLYENDESAQNTIQIRNNTFAFNHTHAQQLLFIRGNITFTHNTFAFNENTGRARLIRFDTRNASQPIDFSNNLFLQNDTVPNEDGTTFEIDNIVNIEPHIISTTGGNIFENPTDNSQVTLHISDRIIPDLIGHLADHGGETATVRIPLDSEARGTGLEIYCATTDQRGVARPENSVCDVGAYQTNPETIVERTEIPPGDLCTFGGVSTSTFLDENGNGALDDFETMTTETSCNMEPGFNSLLRTEPLEEGDENCPGGGLRVDTGIDNGDGDGIPRDDILQDGEVDDTSFVCNGEHGADGQDGQDGANGTDGTDGENGAAGPTGADGRDGSDGRDGRDGTDGENGAAGPVGPAGPAGEGCSTHLHSSPSRAPLGALVLILGFFGVALRRRSM